MEERLTREETNIAIAKIIARRGNCDRLQVGAVIVSGEGRIISSGYNGPLAGEAHCSDKLCIKDQSCTRAVHAEANAIYFAARMGISLKGSIIYCTHSPCIDCVEAIVQSGIKEVIFELQFRDTQPLKRLLHLGINVYQYPYLNNLWFAE